MAYMNCNRQLLIVSSWFLISLSVHATGFSQLQTDDGGILPFPPTPTASTVGETIETSKMVWRRAVRRLKPGAPNILIVLIDDVGFGHTDTFGGEIHTPTLSRLAKQGISYNRFHTTSLCSPSRASILTGRNQHRVASGTIAERASDFDGYRGVIPKTSATIAEVLHHYGYKSAAFGKWHNTPANRTTTMGPFDRWPTGHGFDHFYGFIAGETSQYEPRLYENLDAVEPPNDEKYHLSEDLAQRALAWLRQHRAFSPDRPFFMYWAPGATHGPHHIFAEWANKYKGKFDDGWDAYRQRVFRRQKRLGWIPPNTKLTPRADTMASWDSIPEGQRAFQRRLMEIFAGFAEHVDAQVGKLVDGLEELGVRDNTVIFYIWGDNGSSAEGERGSISELLAQNNIPNTVEQQMAVLEQLGGLPVLGTSKTDNMFHAGWAWAGSTPFRSTKQVAAHFGGTRNPLVISWPKGIKPDSKPRSQFHHLNDIAATIYELAGVKHPRSVNGFKQDPLDGISMAYTFADAQAPGRKKTQYFENNASRGIYHDGWFACTFGPFVPWDTPSTVARLKAWRPKHDPWELYDLSRDFSQADNLAAQQPQRLARMQALFLEQARANKVLPIGGGLWTRFHPEDAIKSPYTSWQFDDTTTRMPEFAAPGLGKHSNTVRVDVEVGENTSGVIYALGGATGGLTLYMDQGHLVYEYNMLLIEKYTARSQHRLSPGRHTILVDSSISKPGAAGVIEISVDGRPIGRADVQRTVPGAFTASETFDVGIDLGSPVSLVYDQRRPFRFTGKIRQVLVKLK